MSSTLDHFDEFEYFLMYIFWESKGGWVVTKYTIACWELSFENNIKIIGGSIMKLWRNTI